MSDVLVHAFLQAGDEWRTNLANAPTLYVTAGDLTLHGDPDAFRRLRDVLDEMLDADDPEAES